MNGKNPPTVRARTEPHPTNLGSVVLIVQCPYCDQEHHHGGYQGETEHGHRAEHCGGGRGGYLITTERPA